MKSLYKTPMVCTFQLHRGTYVAFLARHRMVLPKRIGGSRKNFVFGGVGCYEKSSAGCVVLHRH